MGISYPKAGFAVQPDAVRARFKEAHSLSTPTKLRYTLTFQEFIRHQLSSYAPSIIYFTRLLKLCYIIESMESSAVAQRIKVLSLGELQKIHLPPLPLRSAHGDPRLGTGIDFSYRWRWHSRSLRTFDPRSHHRESPKNERAQGNSQTL